MEMSNVYTDWAYIIFIPIGSDINIYKKQLDLKGDIHMSVCLPSQTHINHHSGQD